jgi:hypothetical protein
MGEVEPRQEQRSRATQEAKAEQLPRKPKPSNYRGRTDIRIKPVICNFGMAVYIEKILPEIQHRRVHAINHEQGLFNMRIGGIRTLVEL